MRPKAIIFFAVLMTLSVVGPLLWLSPEHGVVARDSGWLLGLVALLTLGLKTWFADHMADRTFNVQKAATDVVITLGAAVVCFAVAQWASSIAVFPGSLIVLGDASPFSDTAAVMRATNILAALSLGAVFLSVICSAGGVTLERNWIPKGDVGKGGKLLALGAMGSINLLLGAGAWMAYFVIVLVKG